MESSKEGKGHMRKIHWSHIVSGTGFMFLATLALYSPHTRSSMSQPSREKSLKNESVTKEIEILATPLSKRCWGHLEHAAKATELISTGVFKNSTTE